MSRVLVNFIQDRSGSMQSVWDETISGFKKFVENLCASGAHDGIEYLLSVTTFDTLVETPVTAQPINDVDMNILAKHGPRGATALYDAVGATIQNTDADRHGAEKIIIAVVTDGHENSSREWNKDRLHAAVDARISSGNWSFTYLGTQPETWDDAGALGIAAGAVATYRPAMAQAAYSALASSVSRLPADKSRLGTRNLMADYLSEAEAAAAGIQKTPKSKTAIAGSNKPEKATHWR